VISWKHSYNRLNEEYEIAIKKKQALDGLYEKGKISQSTHSSFNSEIATAISEIEKQQQDLITKMQAKTDELQNQIKTLEVLLANYEIQHVTGEIDENTYNLEINLIASGLDTARRELDTIQNATNQLNKPVAEAVASEAVPEPVAEAAPAPAPIPEPVAEIPAVAPAVDVAQSYVVSTPEPIATPAVEATPAPAMEAPIAEAVTAPEPVTETPVAEAVPVVEAPIEPVAASPEPAQEPVITPVAEAPVEAPAIDAPTVEVAPIVETPKVEEAPIVETPKVEEVPAPVVVTAAVEEAPAPVIETPVAEAPIIEQITIVETAPEAAEESTVSNTEMPVEIPVVEAAPIIEEEKTEKASLDNFDVAQPDVVQKELLQVVEEIAENPLVNAPSEAQVETAAETPTEASAETQPVSSPAKEILHADEAANSEGKE
jgi:hypothetical protein